MTLPQKVPAKPSSTNQLNVMPLDTEQQSAYCTHPDLLDFNMRPCKFHDLVVLQLRPDERRKSFVNCHSSHT